MPVPPLDPTTTVTVHRADTGSSWRRYRVEIDGRVVGHLGRGDHVVVPVRPGAHQVQARRGRLVSETVEVAASRATSTDLVVAREAEGLQLSPGRLPLTPPDLRREIHKPSYAVSMAVLAFSQVALAAANPGSWLPYLVGAFAALLTVVSLVAIRRRRVRAAAEPPAP